MTKGPQDALVRWSGVAAAFLAMWVVSVRPMFAGLSAPLHRNILVTMAVLMALMLMVLGAALSRRITLRAPAMTVAVGAFLVVLVAASVFAGYHFAALVRLIDLVGFLALAIILVQLLSTRRRARLATAALVATLAVLALNGLHQHFFGLPEIERQLPEHIEKLRAAGELPEAFVPALIKRARTGDVFGTFITANGFAGYLILVIPAAAAAAWIGWRRRHSTVGIAMGALCALTALAALFVLWLTMSKGGMLAFAGALAIGAVVLAVKRLRTKPAAVTAKLLLALLLLFCPSPLEGEGGVRGSRSDDNSTVPMHRDRGTVEHPSFILGDSAEVRIQYWRGSWQIFRRHPFLGVGPGNWGEHYHRYRPPEGSETHYAHNDTIEIACETGIVGLAAYLAVWIAWFAALRRKSPAPDDVDEAHPRAFAVAVALAGLAAVFYVIAGFIPTTETALMLVIGAVVWLAVYGVQAAAILRDGDAACGAAAPPGPGQAGCDETDFHGRGRPCHITGSDARLLRRALIVGALAFLLHSGIDFDLSVPGVTRTLACVLAAAVGLREVASERHAHRLTSAGQLGLTLGIAAPAALLLFGAFYPLTTMSFEMYRAREVRAGYADARRSADAAVKAGRLAEADAHMARAGKLLAEDLPETLERAAEAYDGNAEIQLALADAAVDFGRYGVARAELHLAMAEQSHADAGEILRLQKEVNLARARDVTQNPWTPMEEVRKRLDRAKALRPEDPAPWVRLADILVSRMKAADRSGATGRAGELAVMALDEITQAVNRYPARPELRITRAEILERLGRPAEAIEEYIKALDFARRTSMKELKFTPEKEAEIRKRIEELRPEGTK